MTGMDRRTNLIGIALITTAFALFSVTDTLMKVLSAGYPLMQTVFTNALFSLVPVVALALAMGGPAQLATRRPGVQLLRAVLGIGAGYGAFYAYTRMPIADAYAILFSSPLIITALSGPLLGERVDARRWAAVLVGFTGVLIMLRPTDDIVNPGALGALVSALCFSLSGILVRRIGRSETAFSYPFYGNLLGVVLLLPVQPFVFVTPAPGDFGLMALGGLCGGGALLCLLAAFRMAPAPVVAPFQYTQMLWGVLSGALVFGDAPSPWLALGGGIVIASGLYILRCERRQAARPAATPA